MRHFFFSVLFAAVAHPATAQDTSCLVFGKRPESLAAADAQRALKPVIASGKVPQALFLRSRDGSFRVMSYNVMWVPNGSRDALGPFRVEGNAAGTADLPFQAVSLLEGFAEKGGRLFVDSIRARFRGNTELRRLAPIAVQAR